MTCEQMYKLKDEWKMIHVKQETIEIAIKNIGLDASVTMRCSQCNRTVTSHYKIKKIHGTNHNGSTILTKNCSSYSINVWLVLCKVATGIGPSDLSSLMAFLGLPSLLGFANKQFYRIEYLIGKYLRTVAKTSMDKALELEVTETQKANNLPIQSYQTSDEKIGLTVSYDMHC